METDHIIIEGEAVKEILHIRIPAMGIERSEECTICKVMSKFADYTIKNIKQGNIPVIRDCFTVAEQLFEAGSKELKLAVENVYLFSVTTFMDMTNAVSRQVKELLPPCLATEYHRQVNASHP